MHVTCGFYGSGEPTSNDEASRMRKLLLALVSATMLSGMAQAAAIYPLDRATVLAGSPFDFKVEFDGVVKPEDVKVTVNGQDYETVFG